MTEMKEPYHMTDEEWQAEEERKAQEKKSVIADVAEAAVELVAEILDSIF